VTRFKAVFSMTECTWVSRCSLLSEYHTHLWFTYKCNFIYAHR